MLFSGEVSAGIEDLGVSSKEGTVKITAVGWVERRIRVRREPSPGLQVTLVVKGLPKEVSTYKGLRRKAHKGGGRTRR